MLKINNLCKNFEQVQVLNNINLTVETNQIIGLVGPSGSGKSTLLRLIQKLELPDFGSIEFNKKTGFMFQDFQLFPHMTILENLTYAPKINNKNYNHNIEAMQILKILGIEDKALAYPCQLSGGQKQRTALARSLMMKPKLLLCDEPTSGLDIHTIEGVSKLLIEINKMGIMMIIASHDLDFLTKISNRIILLKDGKIVADIEPQSMENPIKYLTSYY